MSVARAREFVARARAAGIVVHESDGCYSRGNGQTSAYEAWENHHTATSYGMAPRVLWDGRPDLSGPLCNTAGNDDGSVTLVAAHPANHAGASGGWDTAPLPKTSLFNKLVWGHEIVYPGDKPMTAAQYRTALIVSKIGVDIWGHGDVNRIKNHQGTSITGKWDPGYAPGKTIDIHSFRAATRIILEEDVTREEHDMLFELLQRTRSMHHNGFLALPETPQYAGDLGWFQRQLAHSGIKAAVEGLSDDEANILAAIRGQTSGAPSDEQVNTIAIRLAASLGPVIATELGRRLLEGTP